MYKVKAKKYCLNEQHEVILKQIRNGAAEYLNNKGVNRFGNAALCLRGFLMFLFFLFSVGLIYNSGSVALYFTGYIAVAVALLLMIFALAHDAAHGCLTPNRSWNNFIFNLICFFAGGNAYLWKIRHIHSHHPYPNDPESDGDLQVTSIIRLSSSFQKKRIHAYQHYYAFFLYLFYSLNWIFVKDFVLFFTKKHANLIFHKHPVAEWINLFALKALNLLLFLIIPLNLHPENTLLLLIAYFTMHFLLSFFLIFTFLISHHVMEASHNDHLLKEGKISWFEQQLNECVDFYAESKFACYLFGGFNAHLTHHLFPNVCHIHYPELTRIIRRVLKENGYSWNEVTWIGGIRSHFRLLKLYGRE